MKRATERIRHDLSFRIARVVDKERITPRLVRVTLHDPDFARFRSASYDDHVKLFFAGTGETLQMPVAGPDGLQFTGPRPEGRDYTPRSFDPDRAEVVIDFVLHGEGPAASWAAAATLGDTVGVGGPRASFVVHGEYDWYLLAGDETALPAISRRIEELPGGARIFAFIEVADLHERQAIKTEGDLHLRWVYRSEGENLLQAVRTAPLPAGIGYAFVAGESAASAAIRAHLVAEGLDPGFVKAAGYWRSGEADFDDGHQH